jgi:hypothetical protein
MNPGGGPVTRELWLPHINDYALMWIAIGDHTSTEPKPKRCGVSRVPRFLAPHRATLPGFTETSFSRHTTYACSRLGWSQ